MGNETINYQDYADRMMHVMYDDYCKVMAPRKGNKDNLLWLLGSREEFFLRGLSDPMLPLDRETNTFFGIPYLVMRDQEGWMLIDQKTLVRNDG